MTHKHGWQGTQVRNVDGRTGTIAREEDFGMWLDLHIACADGDRPKVRLNTWGADGGEAGWQWWCPGFSLGPAWLPLGEQGAAVAYGQPPDLDRQVPVHQVPRAPGAGAAEGRAGQDS